MYIHFAGTSAAGLTPARFGQGGSLSLKAVTHTCLRVPSSVSTSSYSFRIYACPSLLYLTDGSQQQLTRTSFRAVCTAGRISLSAGLPLTVTPWPAGAGLLSIGDRTIRLTRPRSAVPLFSSKLSKRFAAVALLTPEVSRLVAVLSPLLHSPLEPALLTQFTGVGLSLAISGPIPRSVNCAHVCSEQSPQVLPAVVSRSDFSRLCLSTPPPGACETRVAPTRAAQRAGWGLVFFSQLALELKIIHPPHTLESARP